MPDGTDPGAPPGLEPVAQRLGGHPDALAARDRVVGGGLLAQPHIQPAAACGLVDEIGDQAVAEQGDRLAILGLGHGFGLHLVEGVATLRSARWRVRPHVLLELAVVFTAGGAAVAESDGLGQRGKVIAQQIAQPHQRRIHH